MARHTQPDYNQRLSVVFMVCLGEGLLVAALWVLAGGAALRATGLNFSIDKAACLLFDLVGISLVLFLILLERRLLVVFSVFPQDFFAIVDVVNKILEFLLPRVHRSNSGFVVNTEAFTTHGLSFSLCLIRPIEGLGRLSQLTQASTDLELLRVTIRC